MEPKGNSTSEGTAGCCDISIWLDKYEDLFSQYDSSELKARTLSDNFLEEMRKMVRKVPASGIELKFNLMQSAPDAQNEALIGDNIHDYFTCHAKAAQQEKADIIRSGMVRIVAGFALITCLLMVRNKWSAVLALHGLEMMLDPLGWFLIWTGLEMVFVQAKKEQPAIDFNLKMATAKLTFITFGIPAEYNTGQTEEIRLAS